MTHYILDNRNRIEEDPSWIEQQQRNEDYKSERAAAAFLLEIGTELPGGEVAGFLPVQEFEYVLKLREGHSITAIRNEREQRTEAL